MKKSLLLCLTLLVTVALTAGERKKPVYNPEKFKISVDKPWRRHNGENSLLSQGSPVRTGKAAMVFPESTIGETIYDLQTSGSSASRIYVFPDHTIAATWMYGVSTPDFTDRGTAYNYYDGNTWGPYPDTRIETIKTGYPSFAPYGPVGEAVISHDFNTPGGLILCKRDQKGSGNWSQTSIPGPTGQNGLAWPRMVSSGNTHQYLHTLAITRPTAYPGGTVYQGLDGAILYSRSPDGGTSWNISNAILPGMTAAEYNGFESNSYAFAEPRGNTIAFAVGDTWTDLFLMKSMDNGDSWTKTIIFQHPYPKFEEAHDVVTDTPWVCDGGVAVALDEQGKAHVFFGLMRVLNSDTTDGNTSYFPYTDGLAYWNEDMQPFQNLNFDTLWNQNHLAGYLQDINGNDTVMEFLGIGTYYLSLSGMPTIHISYDNQINLCFSSVMENLDNGTENYRHIWKTSTFDQGITWSLPEDLTGSIIHNFDECVFPFLSPSLSFPWYYLLYQHDEDPGMAVWGSDPPDPYSTNYLNCMTLYEVIDGINNYPSYADFTATILPNPADQLTTIIINLATDAVAALEITNALGQNVFHIQPAKLSKGEHQFTVNVNDFTPGLYLCDVTVNGVKQVRKLIVQ